MFSCYMKHRMLWTSWNNVGISSLRPCKAAHSCTRCNLSPGSAHIACMHAVSALATPLPLPKLTVRPWQPILNKSTCRMAVCDSGNLDMLDCMLKGLNHLSYVHRRALADGAERGLTCNCCQTASLWAHKTCLSCVISTFGKLPAVRTISQPTSRNAAASKPAT